MYITLERLRMTFIANAKQEKAAEIITWPWRLSCVTFSLYPLQCLLPGNWFNVIHKRTNYFAFFSYYQFFWQNINDNLTFALKAMLNLSIISVQWNYMGKGFSYLRIGHMFTVTERYESNTNIENMKHFRSNNLVQVPNRDGVEICSLQQAINFEGWN